MTVTVAVISGGVGAAKLLRGLMDVVEPHTITAIVNVGDDEVLHGLNISPDLDTITYTLADAVDRERGWGLRGETWRGIESLRRYATANGREDLGWFSLGDEDLGTHLYRTSRIAEGASLNEVTAEITAAWDVAIRLIPATNDSLRTVLDTAIGQLSFQEYFVREHHSVAVNAVLFVGAEGATPAPGVLDALSSAERVVIAPSNPVISVGPVFAVHGIKAAIAARRSDCVAVSPIVGGAALKGPADRLMRELGMAASVVEVARLYRDVAASLIIDPLDAHLAAEVAEAGMTPVVTPSIMDTPLKAAALARASLGVDS